MKQILVIILSCTMGLMAYATVSISRPSTAQVIIINPDLQDGGMEMSTLKAADALQNHFSTVTEYADFNEAPEFNIQGPYPSHVYHDQKVTSEQILQTASGKKEDLLLWINAHNYTPKKTLDGNSTTIESYKGSLDGKIPWVGTESMTANQLAHDIRTLKHPDSRWFYLATTCYGGILHNVAFQNQNVCGLSNAPWSKTSQFSSLHGSLTSLYFTKTFTNLAGDLSQDGRISPFEGYVNSAKHDLLNYAQIILSSTAYIDFVTGSNSYSREERIDYGNNEKVIWERLYAAINSYQMSPAKICGPEIKDRTGQVLYKGDPSMKYAGKALFDGEEISTVPKNYRDSLIRLIQTSCTAGQRAVLGRESLWSIERSFISLNLVNALRARCEAQEKQRSHPELAANLNQQQFSPQQILESLKKFKSWLGQRQAAIEPNAENCAVAKELRNAVLNEFKDLWSGVPEPSLNILPILVDIKKTTTFLVSRETKLEHKNKLLNLIECENKPF